MLRPLSFPIVLLALALPPAAQDLWIVDDDGPGDFASLQVAIDTVSDGDTLLVRAGNYSRFVVDGKGLVIQGEGTPQIVTVFEGPAITIQNLAANQALHLRGFTTWNVACAEQTNVLVQNCAGAVVFEDCPLGQPALESC